MSLLNACKHPIMDCYSYLIIASFRFIVIMQTQPLSCPSENASPISTCISAQKNNGVPECYKRPFSLRKKRERVQAMCSTISQSIALKLTHITVRKERKMPSPLIFHSNQLKMLKGFHVHSWRECQTEPVLTSQLPRQTLQNFKPDL